MTDLRNLPTEGANPNSLGLDRMTPRQLLETINDEDQGVAPCVRSCIPAIELALAGIAPKLKSGGRLFYVGAGTSGRLGCVDASEMPPTYGVSPDLIQGIIAGGPEALLRSKEGAEDDAEAGVKEIQKFNIGNNDAVIGLSVSGRARFVRQALLEAGKRGAFTACITNNPNAEIIPCAEVAIVAETGPEVVTGSTRMKAGTAQKLILNMISTSLMVQLGRVQGNRMVDLQIKCEKLKERARNLVMDATGVDGSKADTALERAEGSVRGAITILEGAD